MQSTRKNKRRNLPAWRKSSLCQGHESSKVLHGCRRSGRIRRRILILIGLRPNLLSYQRVSPMKIWRRSTTCKAFPLATIWIHSTIAATLWTRILWTILSIRGPWFQSSSACINAWNKATTESRNSRNKGGRGWYSWGNSKETTTLLMNRRSSKNSTGGTNTTKT